MISLDNVIAIAGAAKDEIGLMIFGLVIRVPIIVWGSQLVMKIMDRYSITVPIGASLLGWIAGDMIVNDVVTKEWINTYAAYLYWLAPATAEFIVIAVGKVFVARHLAKSSL